MKKSPPKSAPLQLVVGRLSGWLAESAPLLGVGLVCVGMIAQSQARAASAYAKLETESAVYAIPQGDHLLLLSLGYRAALADLLFGQTMVAAGTHFVERRVFHHLDAYLYGILALDPTYLAVYTQADTLLNLSTVEMPKENLRTARTIQERGLQMFPSHAELWLSAGQFMAFLAPQRLSSAEEKREWRAAGARVLQHACDIWSEPEDLPDVCISSARLLSENGERAAAIAALERMIAIADDPGTRAHALRKLQDLVGERAAKKRQDAINRLDVLREEDLPGTNRLQYQLLTPPKDPRDCVGLGSLPMDLACASTFERYGDISDPTRDF